jgi:hypothetical protein
MKRPDSRYGRTSKTPGRRKSARGESQENRPMTAKTQPAEYITTLRSCTCPDFRYRQSKIAGGRCKHMIALWDAQPAPPKREPMTVAEINRLLFGD